MLVASLLLLAGLILLGFGGEGTVRGATGLAKRLRIQPFVIAATVVAFGTSAPELAVTLTAIFRDAPGLALGNVVGSNIANLGLILGLSALLAGLALPRAQLRAEMPIIVTVLLLLVFFSIDGSVGRLEGVVLLLAALAAAWLTVRNARRGRVPLADNPVPAPALGASVLFLLVGLVGLIGGGQLLVEGGVRIAEHFGVAEWVIGVIVLALGTSTPEIAASVVAAVRGQGDIAIGNVIGSNTFNVLLVLGVAATARPVKVLIDIRLDLLVFSLMTLFVIILLLARQKLGRMAGALLLTGYLAYIVLRATSGQVGLSGP